jgi:HlyD family secretion protein
LAARRRYLLAGILIPIVALVLSVIRVIRKPEIPLAEVETGEFSISIVRSGELKAERSITVSAPSVGSQVVITELIPEGTFVKKGDLLAQFDPTELLNRLESAERDLVGTEAELELVRAKNELREKELLEDIRKREIAVKRSEGGSHIDLEDARNELSLARARYETEIKVMEAEILKTEVNIGRAGERVASAKKSLGELSVTAPGDGIVIHEKVWRSGRQVKVQEGDSPWPMQPIISLPDLGTLYVAADVDEIDISRVAVGQRCVLTLEAYPDTSFEGHVRTIGNLARSKYPDGGANVFDVSVALNEVDPRFRPGMMTRAEIVVGVFAEEVFVPIEAVFGSEEGPVVYVRRGGSFEERQVQLGRRNDTHIIVESGLEGSEKVALVNPMEKGEE